MPNWPVQSLQAVWFASGIAFKAKADAAYSAAFGVAAAATQNLPAAQMSIASGSHGQSQVQVQVQLGRVDLFEVPLPSGLSFPAFSDIHSTMMSFISKVEKISNYIGDVNRVALILAAGTEAATLDDASNLVLSIIGIKLPLRDARDISFQINRRITLSSVAVEVNRLMKWSSASAQNLELNTGRIRTVPLALLNIDLNTAPEFILPITAAQQIPMFHELADEAERLCQANAITALA